jgi:asparagine synthase (glutamine-hydrolysing)
LGALVGVFTKRSDDTRELVEDMLKSLRHRGNETRIRVADASERYNVGIGYCAHHDLDFRFAESAGDVLALDGSFFEMNETRQADYALRRLVSKADPRIAVSGILSQPGVFSVLCVRTNRLYAFRDAAGCKPLFCGRNRRLVAFASERKALWKIGLTNVRRVLPGQLYAVCPKGMSRSRLMRFPRSVAKKALTMEDASSRLEGLLKRSIQRIVRNEDRVAVAFSGGLDSGLTAALAKETGVSVELVTVGLSGSVELETAEIYAKQLDLPITVETFSPDSLDEYVHRIVWLIEEPNLMKVSIAIPLHWAAEVAARRGYTIMLCGQGSDELYGGYYKYAKTLDSKGRKALESELYSSVVESYIVNYERDDQATAPFEVELRTPFVDADVIRFSLTIPSELKVKPGNDMIRKWVLRSVGQKLGLPHEIAWRGKKAIQHGTGVEHAILKLAKREGLSPNGYLERIHAEVTAMESMP